MDEVKNYILDKSKARFSHYGYVKTTIGDICHDCKVSKATVYKLFDSKETMVANLNIAGNYDCSSGLAACHRQ